MLMSSYIKEYLNGTWGYIIMWVVRTFTITMLTVHMMGVTVDIIERGWSTWTDTGMIILTILTFDLFWFLNREVPKMMIDHRRLMIQLEEIRARFCLKTLEELMNAEKEKQDDKSGNQEEK